MTVFFDIMKSDSYSNIPDDLRKEALSRCKGNNEIYSSIMKSLEKFIDADTKAGQIIDKSRYNIYWARLSQPSATHAVPLKQTKTYPGNANMSFTHPSHKHFSVENIDFSHSFTVAIAKQEECKNKERLNISVPEQKSFVSNPSQPSLFFETVSKVAERLKERGTTSSPPLTVLPPQGREDTIKQGKRTLGLRIAGLKLKQHEMEDDGNCLFRSFSHQLYGTKERFAEIRSVATRQLRNQSNLYSMFFDTEAAYEKYTKDMEKNGTWGDEICLKALCDNFEVVTYVFVSTLGNWYLKYTPFSCKSEHEAHNCRKIFLSYLSPIHYNSLTYLDDSPITLSPEEARDLPEINSAV